MIFLLQYDREHAILVSIKTFDESERREAMEARLDLELQLRHAGLNHEATILDAADEAAIRRTHARYFESADQIWRRTLAAT